MIDLTLDSALKRATTLINHRMERILPKSEEFNESRLVEAMNYSALSEGKRIRPFLTIISANLFGIDPEEVLDVAVAIELIHVYSLIHDDLPAMDNDYYRRGKPSCHKKFNEATAILAGDSLLTYAFQILSSPKTNRNAYIRCDLIQIITKAIGFNGMAGGQMIDLEAHNKSLTAEGIARLQRLKTGEMFMAAVEAGAIVGKAMPKLRQALIRYAHDIGLAFQIKDDILDHEGKKGSKFEFDEITNEENQAETSIVNVIGVENAKAHLELLQKQAITHLKPFGFKAAIFEELAEFIAIRER